MSEKNRKDSDFNLEIRGLVEITDDIERAAK